MMPDIPNNIVAPLVVTLICCVAAGVWLVFKKQLQSFWSTLGVLVPAPPPGRLKGRVEEASSSQPEVEQAAPTSQKIAGVRETFIVAGLGLVLSFGALVALAFQGPIYVRMALQPENDALKAVARCNYDEEPIGGECEMPDRSSQTLVGSGITLDRDNQRSDGYHCLYDARGNVRAYAFCVKKSRILFLKQ